MPTSPSFGQEAVEKAQQEGELSQADVAEGIPNEVGDQVKIVGERTFINTNGVWIDTRYDPDNMVTYKVAFLSDDYFKLLDARPDIAPAMALGQQVIIVIDSTAYEVISSTSGGDSFQIPTLEEIEEEQDSTIEVKPSVTPKVTNDADDIVESSPVVENRIDQEEVSLAKLVFLGAGGAIILITVLLIVLRIKKVL